MARKYVETDRLCFKAVRILTKQNNNPPSTYQVAKQVGITPYTAKVHLEGHDKLEFEWIFAKYGEGKKQVWWIP